VISRTTFLDPEVAQRWWLTNRRRHAAVSLIGRVEVTRFSLASNFDRAII